MLTIITSDFDAAITNLHNRNRVPLDGQIQETLRTVSDAIRKKGDKAVLEYTAKWDNCVLSAAALRVSETEISTAYDRVTPATVAVIKRTISQVHAYHKHQLPKDWSAKTGTGITYGAQYRPLDRVGLYVPGGRAPLISTAIMTAVPAQLAGVEKIVLVTPPDANGAIHPAIIVAAREAGVHELYRVGGAQAVFALAYGTDSLPRVDKIVGPGNQYVTQAKQMVYGTVDIDKPAGPSEVMIAIEDPRYAAIAAADLLCQLEHDPLAVGCVVSTNHKALQAVRAAIIPQLATLKHCETIKTALHHAIMFHVKHDSIVYDLINRVASEHLVLLRDDAATLLPHIKHAGSIFCGVSTPVTAGDYGLGPNHVLPTSGTARFASPLGVQDFIKYSAILTCSPAALRQAHDDLACLTQLEGLDAHYQAVVHRLNSES